MHLMTKDIVIRNSSATAKKTKNRIVKGTQASLIELSG
jgi:hypothetical protein